MTVTTEVAETEFHPSKGPMPMGPAKNPNRDIMIKKWYPGGRSCGRYKSRLAEIIVEANMSPFPNGPLSPDEDLPDELLEAAEKFCDKERWVALSKALQQTNPIDGRKIFKQLKAKAAAPMQKHFEDLGRAEGFLNQHVVFQKPAMVYDAGKGKEVHNPEHKVFVLIPASCYYEGFSLDSVLRGYDGFEMSCVLPNTDKISQECCVKMFGDYRS